MESFIFHVVQCLYLKEAAMKKYETDLIKTEYCSTHNINLIRLPYYEENNFCDILDQRLYANKIPDNFANLKVAEYCNA